MSTKLLNFIAKNRENLLEDAGQRPANHEQPTVSRMDGRSRMQNAAAIAVDRIVADPQTREVFDEESLQRLSDSIREHGQITPIQVRYQEGRGVYIIVAGERRWRASKLAGLATINCIIVEKEMTAAEILSQQIIENALREDLRPIEQAKAFQKAMELNKWDGQTLAAQLHISPSTVSRSLALLKLSEEDQRRIEAGEVAPTIAIKMAAKGAPVAKPVTGRKPSRERTFRLEGGFVVTVKARRIVSEEDAAEALQKALAVARGQGRVAA